MAPELARARPLQLPRLGSHDLLLPTMVAAPFLTTLHWAGAFLAYGLVLLLRPPWTAPPPRAAWPKLGLAGALALWHAASPATLLNLATLVLADLYCVALAWQLWLAGPRRGIGALCRALCWLLGLGTLWSTALAGPLGLAAPLPDYLARGRLLVLARATDGHSLLIEAALILGAALLAGLWRPAFRRAATLAALAALLLAGSATALLCLAGLLGTALIEAARWLPRWGRNALHLGAWAAVAWLLCHPLALNQGLAALRQLVAGQAAADYGGDFTAGRALLTRLLADLAASAPWGGVGHVHPLLEHGARVVTGAARGATSESPLRLAAKYGWPFFGAALLLAALPLVAGLCAGGRLRRFFLGIGHGTLICAATNAGFAAAQSTSYVLLGPLVMLAALWLQRRRPRGRRRLRLSRRP